MYIHRLDVLYVHISRKRTFDAYPLTTRGKKEDFTVTQVNRGSTVALRRSTFDF